MDRLFATNPNLEYMEYLRRKDGTIANDEEELVHTIVAICKAKRAYQQRYCEEKAEPPGEGCFEMPIEGWPLNKVLAVTHGILYHDAELSERLLFDVDFDTTTLTVSWLCDCGSVKKAPSSRKKRRVEEERSLASTLATGWKEKELFGPHPVRSDEVVPTKMMSTQNGRGFSVK